MFNFPEFQQVITGKELEGHLLLRRDRILPKIKPKSFGVYRVSASPFGIPGRDHASTLLYLQTVEANYKGDVRTHRNGEHMRYKLRNYPVAWESPDDGTRLWDGSVIGDHDDFDCLDDLEAIGLLVNIGTGFQPVVRLTKRGHDACAAMIAERSAVKY